MLLAARQPVPEGHPIRPLFHQLTARGLGQVGVTEGLLIRYLADMLVRFVHIDELYRLRDEKGSPLEYLAEMMPRAEGAAPVERREAFRHIGDFSLFVLGFYPESLLGAAKKKKGVDPDYYAEQGRRSYWLAAEMGGVAPSPAVLRELSEHFEICALGLHWVREYTHDPFFQYMLRQFQIA
jgi:hypothetical protein